MCAWGGGDCLTRLRIRMCKDSTIWQQRNKSLKGKRWFLTVALPVTPSPPIPPIPQPLSLIRQLRTLGLSGILNPLPRSGLYCVSRATGFPFSAWQYPSFLFISHLWGGRKWITGLSRRGTGAITVARSKRNFDIWGLLAFHSRGALGVCYGTSRH